MNTEYGRLVNVKSDWDRNKPKSYSKPTRNVSAYQVSNRPAKEEREEKRNPVMKSRCIFCSKDGHSLGRCFMFQEKSHAERKRFISEKGLCNLCLSKGHFASKCQRGRKCFVVGCSRRHHPLLNSSELKQNKPDGDSTKANEVKDQEAQAEAKGPNAQTGHCGATDTMKRQVCLRVIPVKVFSRDSSREKITYATCDEGSNATLVKESLMNELGLEGQPIDFKRTTMNNVSKESGKSQFLYVQGLGQKECLEVPNALSIKDLSVARSCIPTKEDINKWSHLSDVHIPELKNPEVTLLIGTDVPEAYWKLEERRGRNKEPYAIRTPLGWSVAGPMETTSGDEVSSFLFVVKMNSSDRQWKKCLKWISVRKRTGRILVCL